MALFLLYIIKSSICFALLYLFYILVMRSSTFFRFNRITLLAGTVMCILLPFLPISVEEEQLFQLPIQALNEALTEKKDSAGSIIAVTEAGVSPLLPKEATVSRQGTIVTIIGTTYILGAVVAFLLTLSSLLRIWQLIRTSRWKEENGYRLVVTLPRFAGYSYWRRDYLCFCPAQSE